MDISNLMDMANQLREQLAGAQQEAKNISVTGEAGGGLVRVVVSGQLEVQEINIEPKAVDPNDLSLLEDLLRAAVNDGLAKVNEQLQGQMGDMARQLGIDPSTLGGGGSGSGG